MRTLVLFQIGCIALLGAGVRWGDSSGSPVAWWVMGTTVLGFYPVLVGFPAATFFAARDSELPPWKRITLIGIEVTLGLVTTLAVLPPVQ